MNRKSIARLRAVFAFILICLSTSLQAEVIVQCPSSGSGGDFLSRGIVLPDYQGNSIDSITLYYYSPDTNPRTVDLTIRQDTFAGAIVGSTVSESFTPASANSTTEVTFDFGGVAVTPGTTLTLSQSNTGGLLYFNIGVGPCDGVYETSTQTDPFNFHRDSVGITVNGNGGGGVDQETSSARFTVTKDFSDNNGMPVEVTLTCNGGIPLQQSFMLSDPDSTDSPDGGLAMSSVTFTVTDFLDGAMDCMVTEAPVAGYTTAYTAGGDSSNDDDIAEDPGCHFHDVNVDDTNTCVVSNTLEGTSYTVDIDWMIGEEFDGVDLSLSVDITCENYRASADGALMDSTVTETMGPESSPVTIDLFPNYSSPPTRCRAIETPSNPAVHSDGGCADWEEVGVNGEETSCLITATVFFEGIPTLSAYGLAILVLVTLGVGLVGVRRIV